MQNKANNSWRHHYIPEFYLKGFTNQDNSFFIYLVKENRYKKEGQLFSPESHFFKKHDNTTYFNDIANDFLEKNYSNHDNMVAKVFDKLRTNKSPHYEITNYERIILQYFAACLFWRLPKNRILIDSIIENKDLKEMGLIVKNLDTNTPIFDQEFEADLKKDSNFIKMLRFWFPNIMFKALFNCTSPTTIFTLADSLPSLCSDNPLILRNPNKLSLYTDDFILPLSKNIIFIRTKKLKDKIPYSVKLEIDMMIVMQSQELVCTTDQAYPIQLKEVFFSEYGNLDILRKSIFEKICAI